ncbi:creatininase family protein [Paenibacillus sedimenti]|uniref:Creatininase family protein n=1 Tax=Paenibacillus sedimenti TaxID=2770274 RepID=A0A926KW87_9BACL|nr:creatininase family protein [Paenibacillus sedimenti]MBD0384453.1 creatininase family protein [Paenibacillus sedimenti]
MDIMDVHGRDIQSVLENVRFAVVPLGSIEYHGPHSPLGTDVILANEFARRLHPSLKPLIYPAVPYTACPGKTRHYPGTISVSPSVITNYLHEIVDGICQLGIRNVLLLNAHDGNMGVSRTVAEAITATYKDASVLLVNWWQMVSTQKADEAGIFTGTQGRGHGGPYEMSVVKAFRPELVHVRDCDQPLTAKPSLSNLPYILVEGSPEGWDGYTGHIGQISLQAGNWIIEEAGANLHQLIENWLQKPKKKDGGEWLDGKS